MKVITGKMGSGKTTTLIKMSAETGYTLVVRSSMIGIIEATARTLKITIPTPLSYYDIIERRYLGQNHKGLLIDDFEDFLSHILSIPVEAVSTRSENIVEVKKEDWKLPEVKEVPQESFGGVTTDRNDPGLKTILPSGMQQKYLVLSEDERKKGFVRPYRDSYRHLKCGTITVMGRALSETYARNPKFYGATYCVHCGTHFPLKDYDDKNNYVPQFTWYEFDGTDGPPVGD